MELMLESLQIFYVKCTFFVIACKQILFVRLRKWIGIVAILNCYQVPCEVAAKLLYSGCIVFLRKGKAILT